MNPPTITRRQAQTVDRLAVEQFSMSPLVLMENAGRQVADTLQALGIAGPVVICCGKGNNAGDGFVVARHLELRGYGVRVIAWSDPAELRGEAAANFAILAKTDVPIEILGPRHDAARLEAVLSDAAWVVDALLGTGAVGEPRPPLDAVIDQLNTAAAPRLAIDVPSGLDCDTGAASVHTIRADHTCTFVALKPGFLLPAAQAYTGQTHVLDIGVPRKLVERVLG